MKSFGGGAFTYFASDDYAPDFGARRMVVLCPRRDVVCVSAASHDQSETVFKTEADAMLWVAEGDRKAGT